MNLDLTGAPKVENEMDKLFILDDERERIRFKMGDLDSHFDDYADVIPAVIVSALVRRLKRQCEFQVMIQQEGADIRLAYLDYPSWGYPRFIWFYENDHSENEEGDTIKIIRGWSLQSFTYEVLRELEDTDLIEFLESENHFGYYDLKGWGSQLAELRRLVSMPGVFDPLSRDEMVGAKIKAGCIY